MIVVFFTVSDCQSLKGWKERGGSKSGLERLSQRVLSCEPSTSLWHRKWACILLSLSQHSRRMGGELIHLAFMLACSLFAFLLPALLLSLCLQAPLDKTTLCANKINLYIALIFFLADNNRADAKKSKIKKLFESRDCIQFSVHLKTRLVPAAARSSECCWGSGANICVCVHFNDINSI